MRAPPLLLLLLMAAAGLAVSPLARLNPWLSACDLEEEGAGAACAREHGAACGGGGAGTLAGRDARPLCALGAGARARRLAELRLRACCERSPASALDRSARAAVLAGGERCERTLHDLLALDAMVARVHCDFATILERYDCDQSYSVHTCNECQVSAPDSRTAPLPSTTTISLLAAFEHAVSMMYISSGQEQFLIPHI